MGLENLDYNKNYDLLYETQDKIINLIKNKDLGLYLTGGTALHRFYFDYRYSEDLDFFTLEQNSATLIFRNFIDLLEQNDIDFTIEIHAKDFKRLMVQKHLKIDLVNDWVKHWGTFIEKDGILLDNLENIFTNKLTAMFDREAIRDVFDIYILLKKHTFHINDTIVSLEQKTNITIDLMYAKLLSFPIAKVKINDVDFKSREVYENFKKEYKKIIQNFFQEL